MIIERLSEQNQELYKQALESLRTIIRSSTTSMTSVPKPLKYMIPHYSRMKEIFEKIANNDVKVNPILFLKIERGSVFIFFDNFNL